MVLLAFEDVVVVLIWEAYADASRRARDSPGHHFQLILGSDK
jgi:hypothetical protein